MDKNNFSFPFTSVDVYSLSGYSLLMTFFVLFVMLVVFLRKKVKNYLQSRDKLINVYETYDRKRECRNTLRVRWRIILVSL